MNPNTHSTQPPRGPLDDNLDALEAAARRLATRDLDQLPTPGPSGPRVRRRLLDGLDGHWLRRVAVVDGRGAAGAEDDLQIGSTAAWLRSRLRMGAPAASSAVRTARALFRGPLVATGQLEAEAGQLVRAAWPPLARPPTPAVPAGGASGPPLP